MELSDGELPVKRQRKRLFDLNVADLYDVDALFEESGSEYSPGSEIDGDLEEINLIVSIVTCDFLGYVGYHVLNCGILKIILSKVFMMLSVAQHSL